MITLNDIPFDYLVYWGKKNRTKASELSYLNTIVKKGVVAGSASWTDVVNKLPSNKCLIKLDACLYRLESVIVDDYVEDNKCITLPHNASQYVSEYDRIKAFISEFRREFFDKDAKRQNRSYIVKEVYEYSPTHCQPTDRGVLAHHLGVKRQRVDQLVQGVIEDYRDCLEGKKVGRISADPILISDFARLKQKSGTMISLSSFRKNASISSEDDEKTCAFIAAVLNMSVMTDINESVPIVATTRQLRNYVKRVGSIVQFFRQEVLGLRIETELEARLGKIDDMPLREALKSLVINSEEFVKYNYDNDEAVTLRWDLLLTIPARICWILFERGAFNYTTAIHQDELVKLYNNYSKQYGAAKITTRQLPRSGSIKSAGCWRVMSIGKTGYWKLRFNKNDKYDLDQIIRDYLRSSNNTSYDAFICKMKALGISRFYKERSLRARYTSNGGVIQRQPACVLTPKKRLSSSERDQRYKCILDYLKQKNTVCTLKEVSDAVNNQFPGTNIASVNEWVKKLSKQKLIQIQKGTGRTPTYVAYHSAPFSIPQTVNEIIVDKALELIWQEPLHVIPMSKLYPSLVGIPQGINSKVQRVSKALHGDNRFVFSGTGKKVTVGLTDKAKMELAKRYSTSTALSNSTSAKPSSSMSGGMPALDIIALKTCLSNEFGDELQEMGIDVNRSIDNFISILGQGGPITSSFSFYDALTYLQPHYARSLALDRERALKRYSLGMVELFLKNFYMLKQNVDIVAEINTNWTNVTSVGLSTIITYTYKNNKDYLPSKKALQQEEKDLAWGVDWVEDARNYIVGHTEQEFNNSRWDIEKAIHHSFLLMLFVSDKL